MVRRRWWIGLFAVAVAWTGCGRDPAPPVVSAPAIPSIESPAPAPVAAVEPKTAVPAKPDSFTVSPPTATITPGDTGVQFIATAPGAHGGRRDVTAAATWTAEPSGLVAVDAGGYIRPLAPGTVKLKAKFEGGEAVVPVVVASADDRAWDFAEDIVPILTRSGCNTGGCHGRADGQNGFHLSFLGYDPEGDHAAITRGAGGRRVSRFDPAASLLYGKATGRVAHGGGPRVAPGSIEETTLREWLRVGAPMTRGKTHGHLTALKVEPSEVRLDEPGPQQLRVVARYADGHERDVTRAVAYRVNDDSAASIGPSGRAALLKRAETDLIVRYQSQVVSLRLGTIINPDLDFDFAKLKRRNVIDEELFKRLQALKVPPSPTATDAAFLRRVTLDLTGEQPQPEIVREFLADKDPDKRVKLVDRLVGSADFVKFWRIKLGDLLQITTTRFNNGAYKYHQWVKEQLETNAPWDKTVRTLLTALGDPTTTEGAPANYALDGPDAKAAAEQTAQRFLALRFRCAQCHDHPFDIWTQDDYFGLAALFAKVGRGAPVPAAGAMMNRNEVRINPKGEVEHLRTKKPAAPKLLGGAVVTLPETEDPRKALADWMTSPENPYFARAMANWVWAQFFGKGLADPPDDLSRANPPVHPELLDALAKHFIAHKFDLRDLIRTVATSEAYGLSSATVAGNERDTRLFSHQVPRPLTAHQMADALAQATDVPNVFPNQQKAVRRAIEIYEPTTASAILDTFGRCPRTIGCASVATPPLSLRQSLLLMGGDVIESKVSSLNGYLASLLSLNPEPDEIVDNLYLRVLCRPATAEEQSRWAAELKASPSLREAAEDLFWALLNSREFAFNH